MLILRQVITIILMITKKIGMKIKIERIKRNLTQEKLAELADIDRGTISKVERGIMSPTIATLEKIAIAFDMKLPDLVNIEKIDL